MQASNVNVLRRLWNRLFDGLADEMDVAPTVTTQRALAASQLNEQVWALLDQADRETGVWSWLVDVFYDDGAMFAIVARDGALYRIGLVIANDQAAFDGDWMRVTHTFTPVAQARSRTTIRRQADGRYRWFSVSASAVLNRVAEIDSRSLFDSFIAHAAETGEYPIRQFFHQGEKFRTGQADWLARDDYLYLTSGVYDDTPLAQVEVKARQNNPDYWGDSIGFLPTAWDLMELAEGIRIPAYDAGINREISTLPEFEAASLFTTGAIQEVTRAMDARSWNALVTLCEQAGEDDPEAKARQMLAELGVEERNRAIEDGKLVTRDATRGTDPAAATEPPTMTRQGDDDSDANGDADGDDETDDGGAVPPFELTDAAVAAIAQAMLGTDTLRTLIENQTALVAQQTELSAAIAELAEHLQTHSVKLAGDVTGLSERMKRLERDDDKKKRDWISDLPAVRPVQLTRPRSTPGGDDGNDDTPTSMADAAERTLAGIKLAY